MLSPNGAYVRAAVLTPQLHKHTLISTLELTNPSKPTARSRIGPKQGLRIRVSSAGDSYLDTWKTAVERERKVVEFQKIAENSAAIDGEEDGGESPEALERKSNEFQKILEVSKEERDRVQRMQVIDRAAAAIAAARAILKETDVSPPPIEGSGESGTEISTSEIGGDDEAQQKGAWNESSTVSQSGGVGNGAPGPDFWSWTPPSESDLNDDSNLKLDGQAYSYPIEMDPVMEKEQFVDYLSIPLETKLFESNHYLSLPPLQSIIEVEKVEVSTQETAHEEEKRELGVQFSAHAAEAANALNNIDKGLSQGLNPDGSRWWKEMGIEQRPDGVVCRWTLTRGVSADKALEWEEKYWEAANQFEYKELGSEKSGRDASGNVWHEFWKESMWQDCGLTHFEKTADKWGKNGNGDEWQEKWWEQYDASGQAEKWAHKWCSIDPSTPLEAGHAHQWHERWGEKYDGQGSSMKYTDKWAERSEGDGWTKWGDKWDENFDSNACGVKQGETWWQGKHGERWNRTWGEGHNGSGWVHKYGKSSSGEHWDTHVEQDTWYERFPHFGFDHCFENSVQLREVQKPSEWS
ncbi:Protein RNA-directed DNA methylation like [Actinidia chinensis var. chinensis]|uniref:Protein RNA-directed DNA methylation like n=1 Tax=Actinidia chinensis var. chinensis TaxID=1590841 RepID=A0A2R6Q3G1_ACTCC|nr:Protein RNA-directed DNA methylation like [Actinidia chinensis var. chinensis]